MRVGRLPAAWEKAVGGRIRVLLPFALAAGLALWSGQRLIRMVREINHLTRQVQNLEQESLNHELLLASAARDRVAARFAALREGLVEGEAGARDWLQRVASVAAQHGFVVKAEFGLGERPGRDGLVVEVVPVQLEFSLAENTEQPTSHWVRLVELWEDLESMGDALLISGLVLQGRGHGLEQARLSVRLWTIPPES